MGGWHEYEIQPAKKLASSIPKVMENCLGLAAAVFQ